jgi:hypothetical protein
VLSEADGTDAFLDALTALVATRVEAELYDDFDPPNPDSDETINIDGTGMGTLYLPRRTRSLTSVNTRDYLGTLTLQASTAYRLKSSLNAAGTAMDNGRHLDVLEALYGLTTIAWPYGVNSVQLVGKFGWAAVPDDIKRLVALKVYDLVKANADPLSQITQRTTVDAIIIQGESREVADIVARYRRDAVMAA